MLFFRTRVCILIIFRPIYRIAYGYITKHFQTNNLKRSYFKGGEHPVVGQEVGRKTEECDDNPQLNNGNSTITGTLSGRCDSSHGSEVIKFDLIQSFMNYDYFL